MSWIPSNQDYCSKIHNNFRLKHPLGTKIKIMVDSKINPYKTSYFRKLSVQIFALEALIQEIYKHKVNEKPFLLYHGPNIKIMTNQKIKNISRISGTCKWDKAFKNGPSKICGRQPLKHLKRYGLLFKYFKTCLPQTSLGPFLNTLSHMLCLKQKKSGELLPQSLWKN